MSAFRVNEMNCAHTIPEMRTAAGTPTLWPAFGLGLAVAVGNGLARFAYALLLPSMRADLGWSYAQAGWLNTANALGYVVGAVSGYLLLNQFSARTLFIVGLCLTFLSLGATGIHADVAWLSGQRLLSGIGAAWVFSCGSVLVQVRYRNAPHLSSSATGLFFAGAGIGIAASGLVIGPLLAILGDAAWPRAWLTLGALGAAASIWPLILATRTAVDAVSNYRSLDAVPLTRLGTSMAAYFFFATGYIVYMTFIFAWLGEQGLPWQFGTVVWTVLGIGVAVAPFAWRKLLDRWPGDRILSASCAVTLAGTLVALIDARVAVLVSAALFGLGVFIAPSAIAILVRQSLPPDQIARAMTLFTAIFAIGQAIGPVLAGSVADKQGLDASLAVGAILLGVAAILPLRRWLRG